jgi:membrane protein YqaA with SNARE-associated domain
MPLKRIKTALSRLKEFSLILLHAAERRGLWAIFLYAFLGSLILPIPIDSVLSGLVFSSPRRWLRLTLAFASASVMGGIITYCIGYGFIDVMSKLLISDQSNWHYLTGLLQSDKGTMYLATVSLLAGPFKLSMLAAGATGVNFTAFAIILLLTRPFRFLVIGFIARFLTLRRALKQKANEKLIEHRSRKSLRDTRLANQEV